MKNPHEFDDVRPSECDLEWSLQVLLATAGDAHWKKSTPKTEVRRQLSIASTVRNLAKRRGLPEVLDRAEDIVRLLMQTVEERGIKLD